MDDIFLLALKRYFGYDAFRSIQRDIVQSIAAGHDTLGLMPTGGGKSITFQVPALTMEGVCIVVTPLIALMKDQVQHLKERGIKAEALYSGQTKQERDRILDNAIYGAVKFLYVSPERLKTQLFLTKLYYMKVCFITVDEAHCISQWGYDFRPPYLQIADIREILPDVPVLALTATATPMVVEDIRKRLRFGEFSDKVPQTFQMSFKRDNLSYVLRRTVDKETEMLHILRSVPGTAIIYTRNRAKTKETAEFLLQNGISATYYHAGLDRDVKDERQLRWQKNDIRVMVATNAFGMGIDKEDVRLVIHIDCPDSLEAYFQEAGRGGRDGKRSYAVLLYNKTDRATLLQHAEMAFPPKEYVRKVYDHLAYYFELAVESGEGARYEFNEELFCIKFHHFPATLEGALGILQNAGYISYDPEPDSQPRIMMKISREEMYYLQNLTANEDNILNTLLRYYGSLFSTLTYINEQILAEKCGLKVEHFRFILSKLAERHIITYIPRSKKPLITYLQQRIDSSRLRFPPMVYEEMRERLSQRINAVLRYTENDDTCRQTMLINYFGEETTARCGHCDVCLDDTSRDASSVTERIMAILADGKEHHTAEIKALPYSSMDIHNALEQLREEGRVVIDNGKLIIDN